MTELEYKDALSWVESNFDNNLSIEDSEKFDKLCKEIESYEDEHFPVESPTK